jgi:hypothetical protein
VKDIITGDAMLAPNPWQHSKRLVDIDSDLSPAEVLESITYFLQNWPGDKTVNLELERRHGRFIQIIGGYAVINGRFPLDWPLHYDSSRALRLSRYLDTLTGKRDTSLRSLLLQLDTEHRYEFPAGHDFSPEDEERELRKKNKACVASLLHALRIKEGRESAPILSNEEERFLTNLHSLDSNHMQENWPWDILNLSQIDYDHDYFSILNEPTSPRLSAEEKQSIGELMKSDETREEGIRRSQINKEWKIFDQSQKPHQSRPKLARVRFEFSHIQTWMNKRWLGGWIGYNSLADCCSGKIESEIAEIKKHEDGCVNKGDAVGQRFLRGLSAICELSMSRIREYVIRNFGLGSVIIDGGGRIEIAVPEDDVDSAIQIMNSAFEQTFLLSQDPKYRAPYLNRDVREVVRNHIGKEPKRRDMENFVGRNFVLQNLPPRRCYQVLDNVVEGEEKPSIHEGNYDTSCMICCYNKTIHAKNPTKPDMIFWRKMNSFAKDNSNNETSLCMMHRLSYSIGTSQRLRDSILRQSSDNDSDNTSMEFQVIQKSDTDDLARTALVKRAVHSITLLDGNSLGVFFSQIQRNLQNSHDLLRRTSFRFNSSWYISLSSALSTIGKYGADRIAAWVCAGDDLVIAQYGAKDMSKPMDEFLELLDKELSVEFKEVPYKMTFAGGTALRKRADDGVDLRIRGAYLEAVRLEKIAKCHWKTKAELQYPKYLILPNGKSKEPPVRIEVSGPDIREYKRAEPPFSAIIRKYTSEFSDPEKQKEREIMVISSYPLPREQIHSRMLGIVEGRSESTKDYTLLAVGRN